MPDRAIISDSSCLIALTDIGKLEILNDLYKEVVITPEVVSEYKKPLPSWIGVKEVENKALVAELRGNNFGSGEAASIALALESKSYILILDETRARNFALKKGLEVTGTLSVIAAACNLGYIENYDKTCDDLRKADFRFTKELQETVKKNAIKKTSQSPSTGRKR